MLVQEEEGIVLGDIGGSDGKGGGRQGNGEGGGGGHHHHHHHHHYPRNHGNEGGGGGGKAEMQSQVQKVAAKNLGEGGGRRLKEESSFSSFGGSGGGGGVGGSAPSPTEGGTFYGSARKALMYNNYILLLCSVALAAFCAYLAVVFYRTADPGDSLYMNWVSLGTLGVLLALNCIVGIMAAKRVNLQMLKAHFWLALVFLAPLLLFSIACFDFYQVFRSWIRHHWDSGSFTEIRHLFCEDDTADEECRAPILGGENFTSVDDWCLHYYNSTACGAIREVAEDKTYAWTNFLLTTQGIVCTVNVVELAVSLWLCIKIITVPVIMDNCHQATSYLLCIPVSGCILVGDYLRVHRHFGDVDHVWLWKAFVVVGCVQAVIIPMTFVAGRYKSRRIMLMYETAQIIVFVALVVFGILAMYYSFRLSSTYGRQNEQSLEDVACKANLNGCCCCEFHENEERRCPEWKRTEVLTLMRTDLKLGGLTAFLSLVFVMTGILSAHILRVNLRGYKSEYI